MAHFEKKETTFRVTDSSGHTAALSAQEAEDLLIWLSSQRDSIFRLARNLPSYQESQRQHICPFCGSQGMRHHDPMLDRDPDLEAYRCSSKEQHIFFVERRLLQQASVDTNLPAWVQEGKEA